MAIYVMQNIQLTTSVTIYVVENLHSFQRTNVFYNSNGIKVRSQWEEVEKRSNLMSYL